MRRMMRPALMSVAVRRLLTVAASVVADKSRSLYAKGQDAEARQHYVVAYGFSSKPTTRSRKICATGPL